MDGIRPASTLDAEDLAGRLAEADRLECLAYALTPEAALVDMIGGATECWAAEWKGKVQAIFGVARASALSDIFTAFLLGSDQIPKVRFMKEAPAILLDWAEKYRSLRAFVDQRNDRTLKWMMKLGFTLGSVVPVGPNNRPFQSVWLREGFTGMARRAA